jgi:hypothetical protein
VIMPLATIYGDVHSTVFPNTGEHNISGQVSMIFVAT